MVRKIVEKVPDETLGADLERYRKRAIELGATDAKVITSDQVVFDERVRMKCIFPKCNSYGTNLNCPPHVPEVSQIREAVSQYRYAIFITAECPPEGVVGTDRSLIASFRKKLHQIVARLEAGAFYDGYYLALGFAAGSCKSLFCPEQECSALKPGQACRAGLKARASMEACGMDAFLMATRAGWDTYPGGMGLKPEDIPCGRRLGLVLIY